MRHHLALSVVLVWVELSAILAVLIRDNFVPYQPRLRRAPVKRLREAA